MSRAFIGKPSFIVQMSRPALRPSIKAFPLPASAYPQRTLTTNQLLYEPNFYTALGMLGGVAKYSYSERLRRKELLIQAAKSLLEDIKKCYYIASQMTFQIELEISNVKVSETPPSFTEEQRLSFARFAELQYRTVLASDTRLTNPKLAKMIEKSFFMFIKTTFSPHFATNYEIQKESIACYFIIHKLIIGYERSLTTFITNVNRSYSFEGFSFRALHAEQERAIKKAEAIQKKEILDKDPLHVFKNLTNIFRQNHFDEAEVQSPKNPSPTI